MGELYKLLKQGVKFDWREEHQTAFERIKNALLTAPVLKYADFKEPFILLTDASKTAISYILLQKDKEGNIHPVNYGARALLRAETNYGISDLELLALVQGVKTYHVFLANSKFTCYTDHLSCTFLDQIKGSAGRLGRWSLFLQAYDFEVKYKSGDSKIIQVADALSRRVYPEYMGKDMDEQIDEFIMTVGNAAEESTYEEKERRHWQIWELECEEDSGGTIGMMGKEADEDGEKTGVGDGQDQANEEITEGEKEGGYIAEGAQTTIGFEGEQMGELQRKCPEVNLWIEFLEEGKLPLNEAVAKQIILTADKYGMIDGTLYHFYESRNPGVTEVKGTIKQLVVPVEKRAELIRHYHCYNGHPGFQRLYDTLRNKYFWPRRMYSDLYEVCMTCDVCQRAKRVNRKPVPLRHLPEAGLFDFFSLDTIGPLPESLLGYKYALTVQDWFSGYPEIIPLKSLKAGEIADALYQVFTRTGVPLKIMSDLHASLISEIMNKLTQVLKIKHLRSSSVHHQSILVERLHRTIGQTFRAYIGEQNG